MSLFRQYERIPEPIQLTAAGHHTSAGRGLNDNYYNSGTTSAQPHYGPPPASGYHHTDNTYPQAHIPQVSQINTAYDAASTNQYEDRLEDRRLKKWIRILKFASRSISAVLSALTLAPLVMTLVKFFQTKNTTFTVNGAVRTAWPKDPLIWYAFMYAAASLLSFLVNTITVLSYAKGIKSANRASEIAGYWSLFVLLIEGVLFGIATGIYRFGKEPVGGHFKDLWGWTCSPAADQIQGSIPDVNFEKYCTGQTRSFQLGIATVCTALLTASIYFLAILRLRSKKRIAKADLVAEPMRK